MWYFIAFCCVVFAAKQPYIGKIFIYFIYFFMEEYIAFFDSGIGGLSVLLECQRLLPSYNYIFFSDSKNSPLGNKSLKKITESAIRNINLLKDKFNIKIIVLACNTLTSCCIDVLRKKFQDITFVGVEPCIKLVKDLGYKRALVVSTRATAKYNKTLANYIENQDVLIGDKNLATLIEQNKNNIYRTMPYIAEKYSLYIGKTDCVVLGCTHYVFAKTLFEKLFDCPVFDSNIYVARRVGMLAMQQNLKRGKEIIFCDSKDSKEFFCYFNKIAFYSQAKYVII